MLPLRYGTADVKAKIAEVVGFRLALFRYQRELRKRLSLFKEIGRSHAQDARRWTRLASRGAFMGAERLEFENGIAEWMSECIRIHKQQWTEVGRQETWDADQLHALISESAIVLCTVSRSPTWYQVFKYAMPPLLNSIRLHWADTLPKQGWTDAARRFRAARARDAKRTGADAQAVMDRWHAELFRGDRRFEGLRSRPFWPADPGR